MRRVSRGWAEGEEKQDEGKREKRELPWPPWQLLSAVLRLTRCLDGWRTDVMGARACTAAAINTSAAGRACYKTFPAVGQQLVNFGQCAPVLKTSGVACSVSPNGPPTLQQPPVCEVFAETVPLCTRSWSSPLATMQKGPTAFVAMGVPLPLGRQATTAAGDRAINACIPSTFLHPASGSL